MFSVVSSHYFDLGEVDPSSWHSPELDRTLSINASFAITSALEPEEPVAVEVTSSFKFNVARLSTRRKPLDQETAALSHTQLVLHADRLYREHHDVSPGTTLHHKTKFAAGRFRHRGSILNFLTGTLLPFSLPGFAHFDGEPDESEETILLSHRGSPTAIYSGPVLRSNPDTLREGTVAAWSTPARAVITPRDHGILINSNTLHRKSGQMPYIKQPGIFFYSDIKS